MYDNTFSGYKMHKKIIHSDNQLDISNDHKDKLHINLITVFTSLKSVKCMNHLKFQKLQLLSPSH